MKKTVAKLALAIIVLACAYAGKISAQNSEPPTTKCTNDPDPICYKDANGVVKHGYVIID